MHQSEHIILTKSVSNACSFGLTGYVDIGQGLSSIFVKGYYLVSIYYLPVWLLHLTAAFVITGTYCIPCTCRILHHCVKGGMFEGHALSMSMIQLSNSKLHLLLGACNLCL